MPTIRIRPSLAFLAPLALGLAALVLAMPATPAGAADRSDASRAAKHTTSQRLVVRGDSTILDNGVCPLGVCTMQMVDGTFRGSPVGTGGYTGSLKLTVAEAFENGEGGVCAPIDGKVVLGAGTPNRLVLAVSGDSCQDGAGPPTAASFTGLARFVVMQATGSWAGTWGFGLASFTEDAADHDRMTLIGRIWR